MLSSLVLPQLIELSSLAASSGLTTAASFPNSARYVPSRREPMQTARGGARSYGGRYGGRVSNDEYLNERGSQYPYSNDRYDARSGIDRYNENRYIDRYVPEDTRRQHRRGLMQGRSAMWGQAGVPPLMQWTGRSTVWDGPYKGDSSMGQLVDA